LPVAAVATSLMGKLPIPSNLAATFALVLAVEIPLIFGAGLVFYLTIERPFMRPHWPAELVRWVRTIGSKMSTMGRQPAEAAQPEAVRVSSTTAAEQPIQN
jgi:peptidoglycan/LPS O-acetylase OafA/YrhL